jgi:hypothetical protein
MPRHFTPTTDTQQQRPLSDVADARRRETLPYISDDCPIGNQPDYLIYELHHGRAGDAGKKKLAFLDPDQFFLPGFR